MPLLRATARYRVIHNMSEYENMRDALASIASEFYRLQGVLDRMLGKLDTEDAGKYRSRIDWFSKRVVRAMDAADMQLVDLTGKIYDPGMAVTPVNLDDFEPEETLVITKMTEPLIMCGGEICKTGTVELGRVEA